LVRFILITAIVIKHSFIENLQLLMGSHVKELVLIPRVDTPRSCLGEDSSVGLGSCPRV